MKAAGAAVVDVGVSRTDAGLVGDVHLMCGTWRAMFAESGWRGPLTRLSRPTSSPKPRADDATARASSSHRAPVTAFTGN